ncbi:MAG: DNA-3-methyladenine glycosylase [Bacteroidetes bacterium]|nr:DNA-3-methyladenine glycosylase [Bacteroidota bacterium]
MKLKSDFYCGDDVVAIAQLLLGKVVFTCKNNLITAGIITETEAYNGITDRASHAFGGKRTSRTSVMYQQGGVAYIYLCYGVHSLLNVVTNVENIPHAVLIRSVLPFEGEETMLQRRKQIIYTKKSFHGPGKVSQALGIDYSLTGTSLFGNKIWIEDKGISFRPEQIKVTPRIGVDYAGSDALLPYRFLIDEFH